MDRFDTLLLNHPAVRRFVRNLVEESSLGERHRFELTSGIEDLFVNDPGAAQALESLTAPHVTRLASLRNCAARLAKPDSGRRLSDAFDIRHLNDKSLIPQIVSNYTPRGSNPEDIFSSVAQISIYFDVSSRLFYLGRGAATHGEIIDHFTDFDRHAPPRFIAATLKYLPISRKATLQGFRANGTLEGVKLSNEEWRDSISRIVKSEAFKPYAYKLVSEHFMFALEMRAEPRPHGQTIVIDDDTGVSRPEPTPAKGPFLIEEIRVGTRKGLHPSDIVKLIEIAGGHGDDTSLDLIPKTGPRAGAEIAVRKTSMMTLLTAGLARGTSLALRTRGDKAAKLMAQARAFVEGSEVDTPHSTLTPTSETKPVDFPDPFKGKDVVRKTVRVGKIPDFQHGQVVMMLLNIARVFQVKHNTELYTQLPNGEPAKLDPNNIDFDGIFHIVKKHIYAPDSRVKIIGIGPKATEAVKMAGKCLSVDYGGGGSSKSGNSSGGVAGTGSDGGMAPTSDCGFSAAEMQAVDITAQIAAGALMVNAAAAAR